MKGYIASFCRTVTAAAILTTAVTSTAQTAENLIYNGDFGTATYGRNGASVFQPEFGWSTNAIQSIIKPQVVDPYYYNSAYIREGNAYNWACISGNGRVLISSNNIGAIKENTRYRFSFHIFKDITNIPATSSAYSTEESLSLFIRNSARSNYLVKDISMKPYLFGQYVPGKISGPTTFDFTTPAGVGGASNEGTASIGFEWKTRGAGAMCLTNIKLEELSESTEPNRVVVNTQGYPLLGSKIATLVLDPETIPASFTWRLREGSIALRGSTSVIYNYYAAVTGADGQPMKDAEGNYSLQKKSDGSNKLVAQYYQYGYLISSAVDIPNNALKHDADSRERTYTIDFTNYGKPFIDPPKAINLKTPPFMTVGSDGATYYTYSQAVVTNTYNACRSCTIEVVDHAGNIIATSLPFSTQASPYHNLKNDALYTFYHQRSGEDIIPAFIPSLGSSSVYYSMYHVAGHKPDNATCWANGASNVDLHGNDWGSGASDCTNHSQDVSGGWYDAADHGKYIVNGGVALWTLQNMIERLQNKGTLNTAFPSGKLKLPNNPGYSDLMAEAKVEMEWMLKMQVPATGFKMKVPLGYQDKTQTGTPGPNGTQGVYQVDLTGAPLASSAQGAVAFGGGQLPRLRTKLNLTEVDVSGLVFHAVHDRNWTGIPQNPSRDTQERVLMYPTTAATLNFAAVAAQCSRIWQTVDPVFANTCFNAAKNAWDTAKKFRDGFTDRFGNVIPIGSDIFRYEYSNQSWSSADSGSGGRNNDILKNGFALNPLFNGGGAYGDLRVGDEFYWAGAELYLATTARGAGDVAYHTYGKAQGVLTGNDKNSQWSMCQQKKEPIQCYSWIDGFDWQNTSTLGTLSLLTYNKGSLASTNAKANLLDFANTKTANANLQGYKFSRLPFDPNNRDTHYEWGSNGGILNRAIILGAAADIQTDATLKAGYIDVIVNSMGYLLGRNTLEKSFISGYGNNAMANPHHRWFAKHADAAYPTVPAGYIAGGANTRDIPALRANAPRYETLSAANAALSTDPQAAVGSISDASQRYFDEEVVANCIAEGTISGTHYTPAKCYSDHYRSFATNEVAINWQAPLVWVTQFLSETY